MIRPLAVQIAECLALLRAGYSRAILVMAGYAQAAIDAAIIARAAQVQATT